MKNFKQIVSWCAFLGILLTFNSNAERGRWRGQRTAPAAPVTPVTPIRPVPVLAELASPVQEVQTMVQLDAAKGNGKPAVLLIYSDIKECYQCKQKFANLANQNKDIKFIQASFENALDITHDPQYITQAVPTYVIFDAFGNVANADHELPSRATILKKFNESP